MKCEVLVIRHKKDGQRVTVEGKNVQHVKRKAAQRARENDGLFCDEQVTCYTTQIVKTEL